MFNIVKNMIENRKTRKNLWKIHDTLVAECNENEYEDLTIDIEDVDIKYLYRYYEDTKLEDMYFVVLDEDERKEAIHNGIPGLKVITLKQYKDLTNNEFKRIPKRGKTVIFFSMSPTLYWNVEARSIYASRPKIHRHWWWRTHE